MRFIIEFLFKSRNFLIVYGALLLFVIPGLLSGDYSFENLEIDDSVEGNDSDSHEIIATNSFQGKDDMPCADIRLLMNRSQDLALSFGGVTQRSQGFF